VITCRYRGGVGDRHDDFLSRVTHLDPPTALVVYAYNGMGRVVGTDYAQIDVRSIVFGATSGTYPDLDRFNRITTNRWTAYSGTETDFYNIDLAYDRGSNITVIEDNVHTGFDVEYSIDDIDRVTQAEEGTWSGSAITSKTRDQQWTLDQVGNWDRDKLDLDGDGNFTGTGEHDDDRTHNDVNELTARDTDDDGTDDHTLAHDLVGNMTDDGKAYKFVYDPLGRLRKILDRSDDSLVAEYRYNGLGHRISVHEDTDDDGDVDSNDKWFHHFHNERWQLIAVFREDDTDPKEEYVYNLAGLDGRGGASYIDSLLFRDKDADTAWTAASDGDLEERIYYCQNWRADVSALVGADGLLKEWPKYSAYGIPTTQPGGDANSDGDCDSADVTQVQAWITSGYDVRGDIDLDGDVDSYDKTTIENDYDGTTLGRGALSAVGNRAGYAGYRTRDVLGLAFVRHRVLALELGRWMRRDPLGYVDGLDLYEYLQGRTLISVDPLGLVGVAEWWENFRRRCHGLCPGGCEWDCPPPLQPFPPIVPDPQPPPAGRCIDSSRRRRLGTSSGWTGVGLRRDDADARSGPTTRWPARSAPFGWVQPPLRMCSCSRGP
jgi:RHS repeat-associated protein